MSQVDEKMDELAQADDEIISQLDQDQDVDKHNSDADQLIGAKPQLPVMPGESTDPDDSYRFLCHNSIGSIALRSDVGVKCIEIDFANKTFHKNLVIEDQIDTKIAVLGLNGAFIASKAAELDLDQYEDDVNQMKYISQYKFIPFKNWNSIEQWSGKLPKGESVDCAAIGSSWC